MKSRKGEPTWEIAEFYPRQGEWTEDDYVELDAKTNRMIELSDGCLEILPRPTWEHCLIVNSLYSEFDSFARSRKFGKALFAPLPVRLWPGKFREPDILFLRTERYRKVDRYPDGVDLAVEVVGEGADSRNHDLIAKREEYARAGISEYWIVDPQERRITVLTLDGTEYRVHGEFIPGQSATSVLLTGFAVSVSDVFAAGAGRGDGV